MQAETQAAPPTSSGGSGSGFYGSGSGSGSGSGANWTGYPSVVVSAADLAKQKPSEPLEPLQSGLSLSESIAANFAALSGLLGEQETASGGYSVPAPIPVQSSGGLGLVWILLIGAAVAAYFLLRKKGEEHGE